MRFYTVTFEDVAVSAAQDMVQITGAAGKIMFIVEMWCGVTNTTLATGQAIKVRGRYLPATVTLGSAGTTGITPSKVDPGDAACSSSTCATNNTVKATTSGTAIVQYQNGAHLYQGDRCRFPVDERPPIGPSEAWVWELLSTVSGTVNLSGGVKLGEVGG
jgi:hypothetical protein